MVLLLSLERIQSATKNGFDQSISGVDLIIGPRSGGIELVLYSVFHLGRPTNNITMQTVEDITQDPAIDWLVPIALGDSHGAYRVVATTPAYFDRIKVGQEESLRFRQGRAFEDISDVVIGAEVARALDYQIGSQIYLTHGSGDALGQTHDDFVFTVTGILESTGTPNDQAVFVDLKGYELIHLGWQSGTRVFSLDDIDLDNLPPDALTPKTVTAAFVGLTSKLKLFPVARTINEYPEEAVSAIVPGIALSELWSIVGMVDRAFAFLSWLIIGISLITMVTMTIASLEARTREMTILRATGASPGYLSALVMIEAAIIGLAAIGFASLIVSATTVLAQDLLTSQLGIAPDITWLSTQELMIFAIIFSAGLASSVLPAMMVYRRSVQQGLSQ
jgi:putative ABC transport system permease protein